MNRRLFPGILLLVLLAACTVYKEYPIEVYKPGEVKVSPDAERVALVYRNFKYPGDTLLHYYRKGSRLVKTRKDPANLDSMMVFSCLNGFAKELKNNEVFDEVKIFPYNSFRRHTGETLPEIPPGIIRQMGEAAGSDWLVALETFSCFFTTHPGAYEQPEANEVVTVAVWGIYDARHQKQVERKTLIDTLVWDKYDAQGNYQRGTRLPPRIKSLQIASTMAGEKYAERFYPSWETVYRMYSVPPLPDFSDAARLFEDGKWDRAIALWKKYAPKNQGRLAVNARYNLALAYEMKDDIPMAEKWLDAAYELALSYRDKDDLKMIRAYQKALDVRKKQIKRLEAQ